jgi:hypothetical protein
LDAKLLARCFPSDYGTSAFLCIYMAGQLAGYQRSAPAQPSATAEEGQPSAAAADIAINDAVVNSPMDVDQQG